MKSVAALLVLCVAFASAIDLENCSFNEWKAHHGKSYETTHEEASRAAIFEANLKYVLEHNAKADAGESTYRVAMNIMADLTNEEFRTMWTSPMDSHRTGATHINAANVILPDSVDWRKEGYVTPVKNQGQCGSCWAFSTVGSLEGQHFAKTGNLVSLSEQNLVDCSHNGNHGCQGGLMDNAFNFIKSEGGIDTEASYPYTAKNGQCKFSVANIGATVAGHKDVQRGDENALKSAVATVGPISVAIDASHQSFQMYSSGVYNEVKCSSSRLDHGVLTVGYGVESAPYWLVKNSWGTSWGMNGYIHMSRNADNQCGIASQASYPLV